MVLLKNRRGLSSIGRRRSVRALGGFASLPFNISLPTIAGTTAVGDTLTVTPGAWGGSPAPVLTRQWQRDGVDIASETGLTYVLVHADLGTDITVEETGTNVVGAVTVETVATAIPPIETQIISHFTDAGWTTGGLFLARLADVTLETGDRVSNWVNQGTGGDAVQATDASRPTWNATGLNSLPSLDHDGGDSMLTAAIDSTTATAYVLLILFTDSDTAAKFPCSFGEIAAGMGISVKTNNTAGTVGCQTKNTATSRVDSAASFPMTSGAVVTGTWDTGLATNETEVRHAGVNVSSTRAVNGNNTAGAGSQAITIGAREGPTGNMTGAIAAVVLAWGTTTIPTTELALVETLLKNEWGV